MFMAFWLFIQVNVQNPVDSYTNSSIYSYCSNIVFAKCVPIASSFANATHSSDATGFGPYDWYKFQAKSSSFSLAVSSSSRCDVIANYADGGGYPFILSDGLEKIGMGNSDYERLNING